MSMIMIEANLEYKFHWDNIFTPKCYISQAIGPAGMILGQEKTDYPNLKLESGQYFQVYKKTRNGTTSMIVGVISLKPKNDSGSYYFMSLETGRIIHVRQWTVLHVTESVIDRVEKFVTNEGINEMVDGYMLF